MIRVHDAREPWPREELREQAAAHRLRGIKFHLADVERIDIEITHEEVRIDIDALIKRLKAQKFALEIRMLGTFENVLDAALFIFVIKYESVFCQQGDRCNLGMLISGILIILTTNIFIFVFQRDKELIWKNIKSTLVIIFIAVVTNFFITVDYIWFVIAAILTTFIFSKVKKLSFGQLCDTAGLGLVLGQIIGRWGNFFNREAFGGYCNNLLAMQIPVSAVRSTSDITQELMEHEVWVDGIQYIQVHPTFLYESLSNLILLIILLLFRKHKKFNGEVFLFFV